MAENDEFKQLIRKRGHIKGRLTTFSGYLQGLVEQTLCAAKVTELELRIAKMESLFDTYDEIQTTLECMSDDDKLQLDERTEFENLYYNTVAAAKELVKLHKRVDGGDDCSSRSERRHSQVKCKLPTISLPTFDGSYDTWLEFHDTFDSLIHKDDSIDDVNKFHYLRASLQGSAALIIQSLALSGSNYKIAWQLVCDRYNNKRLLVNNHITAIFNLNPVTRESPLALRYIIDTMCKNVRALSTLNEPTSQWDTLLIYIVCQKLDSVTRREWEQHVPKCDLITFDELINFLRDRADLLETMAMSGSDRRASWPTGPGVGAGAASSAPRAAARRVQGKCFVGLDALDENPVSSSPFLSECPLCKRGHWLYECPDFLALSNKERADKVQGMNICRNCLKPGHIAKYCRRGPCRLCSEQHNTRLHVGQTTAQLAALPTLDSTDGSPVEPAAGPDCISNSGITLPTHFVVQGQVLLSTALVEIHGRDDTVHVARALLDNGSTSSFMTENLWRKLKLPARDVTATVSGITNISSKLSKTCRARLTSRINKNFSVEMSYFILPELTSNLPLRDVDISMLNIPQHVVLADPKFHLPAAVDLLIGADVYWELLGNGRLTLGRNMPTIYETKLGWVVSGTIVGQPNSKRVRCNFAQVHCQDDELPHLWELDESTNKLASAKYPNEGKACEEHFDKNATRLSDGRLRVRYHSKQPPASLGNTYEWTVLPHERGLEGQPLIKPMCKEFMDEPDTLMSKVSSSGTLRNFLPHRDVLQLSSQTVSLASSTGSTPIDIQLGSNMQNDLMVNPSSLKQYQHAYIADGNNGSFESRNLIRSVLLTAKDPFNITNALVDLQRLIQGGGERLNNSCYNSDLKYTVKYPPREYSLTQSYLLHANSGLLLYNLRRCYCSIDSGQLAVSASELTKSRSTARYSVPGP